MKVKGDPLPDRPHRRSCLVRIPDRLLVVPTAVLSGLAALAPPAIRGTSIPRLAPASRRVAELLDDAGIESRVQPPDTAGIVWYHVEHCPFHDDGRPFECGVGEAPDGRFVGKCFHPEGANQGWRGWKAALGLGRPTPGAGRRPHPTGHPEPIPTSPAAVGGFARTDAGNGEYFARLYGTRLRYDHRRGRWLVWADHWWRDDDTRAIRRLAKEAARERYGQATSISDLRERADEARFAIGSENRQRLDAMLLAAESEPPIADAGDRWDADPWLLGVANGVVDLRTGTLRAGSPDDRMTLHTDVPFEPAARCPRWERFLDEVFAGDDELIGYIARALGYSLTGDTSEQCLFTCYGTGANGKSVFLTIAREIAGLARREHALLDVRAARTQRLDPERPRRTRRPTDRHGVGDGRRDPSQREPPESPDRRRPDHRPLSPARVLHVPAGREVLAGGQPQAARQRRQLWLLAPGPVDPVHSRVRGRRRPDPCRQATGRTPRHPGVGGPWCPRLAGPRSPATRRG